MYDDLILKRLDRVGRVCSRDLIEILNISNVHASRIFKTFFEKNKNILKKDGKYLKLHPMGKIKDSIANQSLIQEINLQKNNPSITGVFDSEFKLASNTILNSSKIDAFVKTILQAIKYNKSLEVVYVSLTKRQSIDEKDPVRNIMPVSFRFFDGLLYLLAVDVKNNKTESNIKMFSLSRFQYIEISENKIKSTVSSLNTEKKKRFILTFNSEFTEEQKQVIIAELQLKIYDNFRYFVDIFLYESFSFNKKYFSAEKPNVNSRSIYPFFITKEEKDI